MRRFALSLMVAIFCSATMPAQQGAAIPQTARQALIEMFFSKTPGTLAKHLPAATRAALEKSGAMASLQQYSLMATQLQTQQQNVQTFETGSVLLTAENPKTGEKIEVAVENDALQGDRDDIEMSFQMYKNSQAQRTPFMPQMTFSMRKEAQVWTLNEISVTVHLPLADPDLLKAVTNSMKAPAGGAFAPRADASAPAGGSDTMVVAAVRTILTAEVTYAATYPKIGYTCTLSSLDGFGGGEPNERQAMLINSGLASGRRYGFLFTLSACTGSPATRFQLTAVPNGNALGRKAFCADESGVIRSSDDGNPASCQASGTPLH